MTYEELANSPKFKELLEQIPESERANVEKAIQEMVRDFEKNILVPLGNFAQKR